MLGWQLQMMPAESVLALVVLSLFAPAAWAADAVATTDVPVDAALLEFLADWDEAAADWLAGELEAEENGWLALPMPAENEHESIR